MAGLRRIAKMCGGLKVTSGGRTVHHVWDYAADEPVLAEDMPEGSERWKASERAKWEGIKAAMEAEGKTNGT